MKLKLEKMEQQPKPTQLETLRVQALHNFWKNYTIMT